MKIVLSIFPGLAVGCAPTICWASTPRGVTHMGYERMCWPIEALFRWEPRQVRLWYARMGPLEQRQLLAVAVTICVYAVCPETDEVGY